MHKLSLTSERILAAKRGKRGAVENYADLSRDIKAAAKIGDWVELGRLGADQGTPLAASIEAVDYIRNLGLLVNSKAAILALKEIAIHGQAWRYAQDTAMEMGNIKFLRAVSKHVPEKGPNEKHEKEAVAYAKSLLPNFKKVRKAD